MSWYMGNTPSVVHDKPLIHGATRMGLLANREGYAAGTLGGLFADQTIVTNLNDSGAGSLRAAVTSGSPAWVTFQQGLTAPARSTWAAPDNNAPIGAYNAANIHQKSKLQITSPNVTIDGRSTQYGVEGFGLTCNHGNAILHNFHIDFSQWWAGGTELQNAHAGALYNINDADATYSHGLQPIQKTEFQKVYRGAYASGTTYAANDVVTSGGVGYRSLSGSNTGHTPSSNPTFWAPAVPSSTVGAVGGTDFGFWMGTWSSGTTYQLGDGVYYPTTGLVYTSAIDTNLNHAPGGSQWRSFDPTNSPWSASTTYSIGDSVAFPAGGTSSVLYISKVTSNLNSTPPSANWWTIGATGSVNGEIYLNVNSNLNNTSGNPEMGFWFDHVTLTGTASGTGTPAKGLAWWDFNDDCCPLCYLNHHYTVSWCHFVDTNKASIIGCNSTDPNFAGDWVTLSHNWFQRVFQRQPLLRYGHAHSFANYFDQDYAGTPGPGTSVQLIAVEKSGELLYEGNLGNASLSLGNALAIFRDGTAKLVGTSGHGNSVTGSMTLGSDQGTVSFSPPYSYSLPTLATSGDRSAFIALIQGAAGQR